MAVLNELSMKMGVLRRSPADWFTIQIGWLPNRSSLPHSNQLYMTSINRRLASTGFFLACLLCIELLLKQYRFGVSGETSFAPYNIRIGCEYVSAVIIYLLWFKQRLRTQHPEPTEPSQKQTAPAFQPILLSSLSFLLLAFIAYPNTKTDIYTYLHSGLMMLDGINPYIVPAGDFPSPLSTYFDWNQTSTYGPISQFIFILSALFLRFRILLAVYIFKLFCLVFHIFNAFLIHSKLKFTPAGSTLVLAYLVNPILLFELVSQAHLDIFLCTSLILLISAIQSRKLLNAVLLVWVGFFTKTLPLIWMPLIGAHILKTRKIRLIALSIFLSILVIAVGSLTLLETPSAWISLFNPGVSGRADRSIHLFLVTVFSHLPNLLPSALSGENAYRVYLLSKWASYLTYCSLYAVAGISVLFGFRVMGIAKHLSPEDYLILCLGWATLFIFWVATPWNPSWYVTILIPIIFLMMPRRDRPIQIFVNAASIYCISSSTYFILTLAGSPPAFLAIDSLIGFVPTLAYLAFSRQNLIPDECYLAEKAES